jgi:hypothetical protein
MTQGDLENADDSRNCIMHNRDEKLIQQWTNVAREIISKLIIQKRIQEAFKRKSAIAFKNANAGYPRSPCHISDFAS